MDKKIGIFDSGIGGLTILKELEKKIPNENYIYYKDTNNNPYGEKSDDELYSIVNDIVKYLITNDVKLIVIACNTATTKCMKKLRAEYPDIIFVGTVPAIKVACDNHSKKTLVMATPLTIGAERTNEIVTDNKKNDQDITLLPCDGLANAIEKNDNIDEVLDRILFPYKNSDIDSVVLGCTHYPIIKDKIKKYFSNDVNIYDSINGVVKEVNRQLKINMMYNKSKKEDTIIIDSSKSNML